jgi:hypothetical protein
MNTTFYQCLSKTKNSSAFAAFTSFGAQQGFVTSEQWILGENLSR